MGHSSALESEDEVRDAGRALGHDLYRHTLWDADPSWPEDVLEGWHHARGRAWRRKEAGYHIRKWVQLRLSARMRGRSVDALVTPQWLRCIDVNECPVLRIPLTHGLGLDSDASIDRLNNDGAYAPGNLAVMSTIANLAKGRRMFEEVLELSRRKEPANGLEAIHWLRLAALMLGPCFVTHPDSAPDIPMPVPLPNGTVRTAFQQVQFLFAFSAGRQTGKNKLVRYFKDACSDESSLFRLRDLAEIVHENLKGLAVCWDVWLEPGTMPALVRWRDTMGLRAWQRVGDLCIAAIGGNQFDARELQGWRLERHGYR
jgi:hypothetical protein